MVRNSQNALSVATYNQRMYIYMPLFELLLYHRGKYRLFVSIAADHVIKVSVDDKTPQAHKVNFRSPKTCLHGTPYRKRDPVKQPDILKIDIIPYTRYGYI